MSRFVFATPARLLAAALLLTAAAGCKKDEPAPSTTALLTAPTWRSTDARLTINGVEGVYTPSATDNKYTTDGKYTSTPTGSAATTGTWALLSNETQLQMTPGSGQANDAYQLATLTSTDLSLSYSYTQAQVQRAINNSNTSPTAADRTILTLIFSASAFTFPGGSPPVSNASQITTLSFKANFKAR